MAYKNGKGMKSATMPKDHYEKEVPKTECSDLKYTGEFSGPEDLKKKVDGLANYVKKHKDN